jgi:hypothetical protein
VALQLDTLAQAALIEAKCLDEQEAATKRSRSAEETERRESCEAGESPQVKQAELPPLEGAIMDVIKTGTILIENGTLLPRSLVLASEPYSRDWTTVTNLRSDFVRDIDQAGWTFFFLAGQIQATVFGFNREKAVHTAVDRLIANAKSRNCNCLEIGQITMKSFLGLPFARVSAHSRHICPASVGNGESVLPLR